MSQENVDIVRRALAATSSYPPDFDTVNALYHPDHVLTSDYGVEGTTYRGMAGYQRSLADMNAAWDEWRQEVEDVLDGDGGVVVILRLKARGKGSGAPVDRRWALVVKLRDGKIVASHAYLEPSKALEAVGLSEQDAHADP